MITPLVAFKKRAKARRIPYGPPPSEKQKTIKKRQSSTAAAKLTFPSPPKPTKEVVTIPPPKMGFVEEIDADEVMADDELMTDSDEMNFGFSEGNDEKEDITTLQPKIPFKERLNALVGPKDEKFLRIENYFFGLINNPGISLREILEGTFENHEITLITPQSGPPDIVRFQLRKARLYYENLETRFKGHTETLAFKLACLYFGLPVEPIRLDSFSSPDPDTWEENVVRNSDPLSFLGKYKPDITPVYDKNMLSLRGGGDDNALGLKGQAIKEIKTEESEIPWNELAPAPKTKPVVFRLYGWQGAMDTRLAYSDFVSQADRLLSNWEKIDQVLFVEIWYQPTATFVEGVRGVAQHRVLGNPVGDKIWDLLQKYFKHEGREDFVCFIRKVREGEENRANEFEPSRKDKHVIRILNKTTNDVAYMRVPEDLHPGYKPHQFGTEYTRAMQVLLLPQPPHAFVTYQDGLIGVTYQYLDPPSGLWGQVIGERSFKVPQTLSFELKGIDIGTGSSLDAVPIIIPGVFKAIGVPLMKRKELATTIGLAKVHKALEVSLKRVNLQKECSAFEIWWHGPSFKYIHQKPTRIAFLGNITNPKSQKDWQKFVGSVTDHEPVCIVVRPVYKSYRLRKPDNTQASLQLNELDVQSVRAFVSNRLYENYNPTDPSDVILLSPVSLESFQPELTIRSDTTEEEWQWMRRNIIEPEFDVIIDDLKNAWEFSDKLPPWGPRYVAEADVTRIPKTPATPLDPFIHRFSDNNNESSQEEETQIKSSQSTFPGVDPSVPGKPAASKKNSTACATTASNKPCPTNIKIKTEENTEALNTIFRNSKNTVHEAERTRILRNRSFATPTSIFTNPLKPVMPLEGPPLESIIKTGPAMPGVSIAMMTPTEVLQLQKEVHSLRFQLLDRTRECPYADCERYFTFADGEGLDRHIREEHNVLRCFLCDKEKYLLPHYNTEQIKKHFVEYHVDDILKAYGVDSTKASAKVLAAKPPPTKKVKYTKPTDEDEINWEVSSEESSEEELPKPKKCKKSKPKSVSSSESSETSETSESSETSDSDFPFMPPPGVKRPDPLPENFENPWEKAVKLIAEGKSPFAKYNKLSPYSATPSAVKPVTPHKAPKPTDSSKVPSAPVPISSLKLLTPTDLPKTASSTGPTSSYTPGMGPGQKTSWEKYHLQKLEELEKAKAATPVKEKTPPKKQPPEEASTSSTSAEIFTAVNPNPGSSAGGAWVKSILEKYINDGGDMKYSPGHNTPGFKLFTTVNTKPGTNEENQEFIKKTLAEYETQGGKLVLQDGSMWSAVLAQQGFAGGLLAQVDEDGKLKKKDGAKKKRKRPADLDFGTSDSDTDIYEYSERSAVPESPANLDPDAPSSPVLKKQRRLGPPPPTPVASELTLENLPSLSSSESESESDET